MNNLWGFNNQVRCSPTAWALWTAAKTLPITSTKKFKLRQVTLNHPYSNHFNRCFNAMINSMNVLCQFDKNWQKSSFNTNFTFNLKIHKLVFSMNHSKLETMVRDIWCCTNSQVRVVLHNQFYSGSRLKGSLWLK